mgnify:CR=1 FL=1
MNQKQIGVIVLSFAVILGVIFLFVNLQQNMYIEQLIAARGGECILDDGTCLHADRNWLVFYGGGALAVALLTLGMYLIFFDKTQKILMQQHTEVASALQDAKGRDEFKAFLSGFSEEEKKVLEQVKEQEGITQSTLRYKTGMSKTSLSLLLKQLEEKGIISRKESGKTNEVYLQKKF